MRALVIGAVMTTAVLAPLAASAPVAGRAPGSATSSRASGPVGPSALVRLGTLLARRLRLPDDEATARRMGRTAVLAVLLLPAAPPAAVLVVAVAWVRIRRAVLLAARTARHTVARTLPDAVDLLLLCTTSGMGLALAHAEIGPRLPGPLGVAFVTAHRRAERGVSRAEALLESLSPLGDRATALAHVLADHLRYGVALGPSLERLGFELRLDQRRLAEEEARKVPIRLLGPLVTCILPAFGLLTVVPLLAASLQRLPT